MNFWLSMLTDSKQLFDVMTKEYSTKEKFVNDRHCRLA